MNSYSIFLKKDTKGVVEDLVLTKEGFEPMAFILPPLWFFANGLLLLPLIYILLLSFIANLLNATAFTIFILLFNLLLGYESNNIRNISLAKSGYIFLGYSTGNNKKEAKRRFLDEINKEAGEDGEEKS